MAESASRQGPCAPARTSWSATTSASRPASARACSATERTRPATFHDTTTATAPDHARRRPTASLAGVSAAATDTALRRTPLYDRHVAAGARLVPFAGWEMPGQYGGSREEHANVRRNAGIFDVSHMGEIETSGPGAEAFLQRILSNDVTKLAEGGAQYSVLCREDGGVLDDLFTYKLGHDRFLTVTNASNHEKDLAWFTRHAAGFDVQIHDRLDDYAMLAIQGPNARALVAGITEGELPKRF